MRPPGQWLELPTANYLMQGLVPYGPQSHWIWPAALKRVRQLDAVPMLLPLPPAHCCVAAAWVQLLAGEELCRGCCYVLLKPPSPR